MAAYDAAFREQYEVLCNCAGIQHGAPHDLCVEANIALDGLTDCERNVLSDPRASEVMQCVADAMRRATECHRTAMCDDSDQACYDQETAESDACGNVPLDPAQFETCERTTFECVGGGTVSYDATCDGYDDCSDGSDEIGC